MVWTPSGDPPTTTYSACEDPPAEPTFSDCIEAEDFVPALFGETVQTLHFRREANSEALQDSPIGIPEWTRGDPITFEAIIKYHLDAANSGIFALFSAPFQFQTGGGAVPPRPFKHRLDDPSGDLTFRYDTNGGNDLVFDQFVTDGRTFQDIEWVRYSVTIDGPMTGAHEVVMYVNGQEMTRSTESNGLELNCDAARIIINSGRNWDFGIADIRIWNGVRTPEEIEASWDMRLRGDEANLLRYWKVDEGSGLVITDEVVGDTITFIGIPNSGPDTQWLLDPINTEL